MTTKVITIATLNVPNANGRIYTAESFAPRKEGVPLFCTLDMHRSLTVDPNTVCGTISNMRVEGNELKAELTILTTPSGQILEKVFDHVAFRLAGHCAPIGADGVVRDFKCAYIAAIDKLRAA